MKIAITGSSGFIGSNFISSISDFIIQEVDLKAITPQEVNFNAAKSVLHLAALVHQMNGAPEEQYNRINRDLAYDVALSAKKQGVEHFVFLSTVKVYGEISRTSFFGDEMTECRPADFYGKSKYEAEKLIKSLEDENFKVAIVRSPIVYGAGVKANMLNLIKIVDKFNILPFGNINNNRSMVYIGNLTALLSFIIKNQHSGLFIAGDLKPVSTTKLVQYIIAGLGERKIIFPFPNFVWKFASFVFPKLGKRLFCSLVIDNSNTNKKIGFIPPYSTEKGVENMVNWYKLNKSLI